MTTTEVKETTGVSTKLNMQPCKGCTERHSGCHSTCEKYIAVQQYNEKKNAALRAEKIKAYDCFKTYGRVSPTSKKR